MPEAPDQQLAGNDRVRERRTGRGILRALVLIAVVVAVAVYAVRFLPAAGPSFRIGADRISVATVADGRFEDLIPVRATVVPIATTFLDAIEGGRIEERFHEPGATLEAGDPIVRLSNTALQLEVIRSEAQVAEQINNLRNTELAVRQNALTYRRQLADIDYNLIRLDRVRERQARLLGTNALPRANLHETVDELEYQRNLRALTIESQSVDTAVRTAQLGQLEASIDRLERNLTIAQDRLDQLLVTAPRAGQLAFLDAEIGQLVPSGARLGQIDDVSDFKLSAQLDEFYLPRIAVGQAGEVTISGATYRVAVNRVFPRVVGGRFEIELVFEAGAPEGVRRGQTLQVRLELGESERALILPNGPFFQDTAGAWVFLLSNDGRRAVRHPVRLGRRSASQIEVLDGLAAGDRVIVSSYAGLLEMRELEIDS